MLGGASPFPNLGQALADDHPISFVMQQTGVDQDPQFDDVDVFTTAGNVLLIARSGTLSPVDRRDAIRLYGDNGSATPPTNIQNGWVECASCHNPHAPRPLFLRLPNHTSALPKGGGTVTVGDVIGGGDTTRIADDPNAGSVICTSCHEK